MAVVGQVSLSEPFAVAGGAANAFETIVREYSRFVYRIAYAVLRNHHDAEDATQETFIRCLRSQKQLALVRDRRAWLARVAWRVALDRRSRLPEVSLDDAAGTVSNLRAAGAGADEIAANHQIAALVERLIASLPRELREPLVLSTVDDLTSPEIAEVLGIPEGSVRTRLLRARQILKEKLSAILAGKEQA